ncbi:MAG: hypothetical protein ACYTHK_12490 [Planctomycetota bacterium]
MDAEQRSDRANAKSPARFAFVLPVVNPGRSNVSDYETVERMLRLTVSSLSRQSHPATSVVVVCHVVPDWATKCSDRVHFLELGDHPGFAVGRNERLIGIDTGIAIDKGMKYLIGSLHALHVLRANHVMLGDADDYVDGSLASFLAGPNAPAPGRDGWIITRGYHAAMRVTADGVELSGAFRVAGFDESCGTCRIFRARSLARHIEGFDPELPRLAGGLGSERIQAVPVELSDRVVAVTDPIREQPISLPFIIGTHIGQSPYFEFAEVRAPLAAKACGHGNHVSRRGDRIDWRRIIGVALVPSFASRFGLEDMDGLTYRTSVGLFTRGSIMTLRRPFRIAERRLRHRMRSR